MYHKQKEKKMIEFFSGMHEYLYSIFPFIYTKLTVFLISFLCLATIAFSCLGGFFEGIDNFLNEKTEDKPSKIFTTNRVVSVISVSVFVLLFVTVPAHQKSNSDEKFYTIMQTENKIIKEGDRAAVYGDNKLYRCEKISSIGGKGVFAYWTIPYKVGKSGSADGQLRYVENLTQLELLGKSDIRQLWYGDRDFSNYKQYVFVCAP